MINILIDEEDSYFRNGIASLLREIFIEEYHQDVHFLSESSPQNIWLSEICVFSLHHWEINICRKEFRYRNHGVVIVFSDELSRRTRKLPLCYRNVIFISRKSGKDTIYQKVVDAWNQRQRHSHYPSIYSCTGCHQKKMSFREYEIIREIIAGTSVSGIAQKLNICEKTVHAHKYIIMKKFNLSGNKDLFIFINHLRENGFNELLRIKTTSCDPVYYEESQEEYSSGLHIGIPHPRGRG